MKGGVRMEEGSQQDQSQVSCPITQEVPTELMGDAIRARPGEGPSTVQDK